MQNGPEHNKIFDWGCILAQNAVKYSLTYTKKLSVSAGAHKPLPLGEVSPKVTERARTLTGNRRHGDSIALTKSLLIAVYESCRTGLALSGASRQLPQRGSLSASPLGRDVPEGNRAGKAVIFSTNLAGPSSPASAWPPRPRTPGCGSAAKSGSTHVLPHRSAPPRAYCKAGAQR